MDIEDYFLKNLSYCLTIKRREQGYSIYQPNLEKKVECIDYINNEVLTSRKKNTRLIYYFFIDKKTLGSFKELFSNIGYENFIDYFDCCLERVKKGGLNTNKIEFINLFHLIGTLRLLKNYRKHQDDIHERLGNILISDANYYPLVIKYSAYQIMAEISFGDNEKIDISKYSFFIDTLRDKIQENGSLTKFIALYSFFYYDFGKTLVEIRDTHLKEIKKKDAMFLKNIHQYIPQIQALTILHGKVDKKLFYPLYRVDRIDNFDKVTNILSSI